MAGVGDIGLPPPFPFAGDAPDLASLQYPWNAPPQPPPPDPNAPPIAAQSTPIDPAFAVDPAVAAAAPALPAPPATVRDLPDFAITTEPPNPPTPDAVTGVGGMPAFGAIGSGPDYAATPTPEQHYQQTAQAFAGNPAAIPDEAERQRYLNNLALRDPAAFAEVQARDREQRDMFAAQRRRELVDADIAAAKQHAEDRQAADAATQAKMETLLADAQRLADTKIDPSGGITGGKRLAGIAAAIIGGLVQARTGSARNAGLDAFNDAVNRGIEAQKFELANKRGAIDLKRNVLAAEFARHGDIYQAEETVRLASLRHIDDILATEQQNYDPRGRTGLLIAMQRAQVQAAQQASIATTQQKFFDNNMKLATAAREQQLATETLRHNRASEGLDYAKLASEAANRKESRDARLADKDAVAAAARDKQILERSIGGEATPIKDTQGNVVGQKLGPMTKKDGSVWVPTGTEAQVSALQKKHAAATSLVQTLDEIRRIGPEWLSDTHNTDKFQRLHELMGDARLQAIAAKDLGVPTGHDIELAEAFLGTNDPTRRKDSIAGLVQARASLVRDHNAELKTHGLDKDWNPPDLGNLPTAINATDQLTGKTSIEAAADARRGPVSDLLIPKPWGDPSRQVEGQSVDEKGGAVGPTGLAAEDNAKVLGAIREASTATPAERANAVNKLAAWAQSPRQSLASGVLGLIRGESPALYDEVVAHLPPAQRDALPDWKHLPLPGHDLPPLPIPKPLPEPLPPGWGTREPGQ